MAIIGFDPVRHVKLVPRHCIAFCVFASLMVMLFAQAFAQAPAPEFECVIEPRQIVKLASPVLGVIANLDRKSVV